ncbi:MAG: S-methyl-5-thioribose-1-phosphate isomerase, partial [Desulfobacterales bacterium]
MKVDGRDIRTIWFDEHEKTVKIIDQRKLPHELVIVDLKTVDDAITAIKDMYVRGAPLIGVTGAYAVYLAALNAPDGQIETQYLQHEAHRIKSARPTAVNLAWGVDKVLSNILTISETAKKIEAAQKISGEITELEVENCRKIGEQGLSIIERISRQKEGKTVNVLTHCNAGWLACIE